MENQGLTTRQQQILNSIIGYYIEHAQPVGSEVLVKDGQFEFSPATTRNEMAELTELGFLEKDHSSAGRYPTAQGFRYYIKNSMEEEDIPVVNEVAIKQRLWNYRHDMGLLLREAVIALSDQLQNLSFIITDEGKTYSAGSVHILRHPEFFDIDLTRTVLHLMDQQDIIASILSQLEPEQEFGLLLGDELGLPTMKQCGMVITRIDLPQGRQGYLNVLGPYRLNYPQVIPTIRYLQQLINELSRNW